MTGKNSLRYGRSALVYHFINWCTYLAYCFLKIFIKPVGQSKTVSPLLITGLFRSGTTISSRIVHELGFSAGPDQHLLKAIGSRKELNPEGFLENHFCMELSMYLFYKTGSWGDMPPDTSVVEKLKLSEADDNKMVWFSLTQIHDDRISNYNKLKVQLQGSALHPQKYFNANFSERSFVKNPHIAVLFPYFKDLFPDSKVLVVFRNPYDAVNSAKRVSPMVNYGVYESYYNDLCSEYKNGNRNILFFSYDDLILKPDTSINKLSEVLNLKGKEVRTHVAKKEIQGIARLNEVPDDTKNLYQFMLNHSINRK